MMHQQKYLEARTGEKSLNVDIYLPSDWFKITAQSLLINHIVQKQIIITLN